MSLDTVEDFCAIDHEGVVRYKVVHQLHVGRVPERDL
jgi:alkyl hydroperoxide reductase subunit AhpC